MGVRMGWPDVLFMVACVAVFMGAFCYAMLFEMEECGAITGEERQAFYDTV